MDPDTEDRLPKFEECLQRLEVIVKEMEQGDLPLEQSLKLFEEGVALSGACRKELEDAEGKIEILMRQNGKLRPEPFGESIETKETR
jgi:exodeoxyribonuclease VII small subunit